MTTAIQSDARAWLAHFNGRGQLCHFSMRDISADELGELQRRVAARFGGKPNDFAELVDLTRCEKECGVPYEWGLAGAGGAYFVLFQLPGITDEHVEKAKTELRWKRDIVRLRVEKIRTLDNGDDSSATQFLS